MEDQYLRDEAGTYFTAYEHDELLKAYDQSSSEGQRNAEMRRVILSRMQSAPRYVVIGTNTAR
jgi:hypothetical protein